MVDKAHSDERIVAAAIVGSFASGEADRYSDVDLSLAVDEDAALSEVMDDWTSDLRDRFEAIHLFDLERAPINYRVFLLPRCLQLDLSFAPSSEFGSTSPRFSLLFGDAKELEPSPVDPGDLLGWAVLFAKDARFNIERGRPLQAEYCIASVRYRTLELACMRLGLPAGFGRNCDRLPSGLMQAAESTFVRSSDTAELRRALGSAIELLITECSQQQVGTPDHVATLREVLA